MEFLLIAFVIILLVATIVITMRKFILHPSPAVSAMQEKPDRLESLVVVAHPEIAFDTIMTIMRHSKCYKIEAIKIEARGDFRLALSERHHPYLYPIFLSEDTKGNTLVEVGFRLNTPLADSFSTMAAHSRCFVEIRDAFASRHEVWVRNETEVAIIEEIKKQEEKDIANWHSKQSEILSGSRAIILNVLNEFSERIQGYRFVDQYTPNDACLGIVDDSVTFNWPRIESRYNLDIDCIWYVHEFLIGLHLESCTVNSLKKECLTGACVVGWIRQRSCFSESIPEGVNERPSVRYQDTLYITDEILVRLYEHGMLLSNCEDKLKEALLQVFVLHNPEMAKIMPEDKNKQEE